jgi:DNA-binding transcriptional ArsR family regulator
MPDSPPRSQADLRIGAAICKALAHPSRLLIIDQLASGEKCVATLTAAVGSDISTVSNHLAVLRNVGLVADERRGSQVFYRLTTTCVTNIFHCIDEIRKSKES